MNRVERILGSVKSTLAQARLLNGAPRMGTMSEGKPVFSVTSTGLRLYVMYGNKLYSVRLNPSEVVEDDIDSLTDSSGGTADGTVAAISGSGDDGDINNNFAELTTKVNSILSKLTEILNKI